MFKEHHFEKFSSRLEKFLGPVAEALNRSLYLNAVRNAAIAIIPLVMIGGISLVLASPPVADPKMADTNIITHFLLSWYSWSKTNADAILLPFRLTMQLMSLFMVMVIGYTLAKSYKLDALSGSITAVVSFLLMSAPVAKSVALSVVTGQSAPLNDAALSKTSVLTMSLQFLDSKGMATAIVVGILSVEIMRFMVKHKLVIRLPEGVPPAVFSAFESMTPILANFLIFYPVMLALKHYAHIYLPELFGVLMAPVFSMMDSAWYLAGTSILMQLLWFVGIHNSVVSGPILKPFLYHNVLANAQAHLAGMPMEYVATNTLRYFLMMIGGSGATLALVVMMLFSKSRQMRIVGGVALLPGLFNINEPVIFGLPLVFNPIMFLPFVFVEPVNAFIAFYATKLGFISYSFIDPPGSLPAPIGAFFGTLDWRAAALACGLFLLDMLLYWPFFKLQEKLFCKQEQKDKENAQIVPESENKNSA